MSNIANRNRLLERLGELLTHRDSLPHRGTRDATDSHLLPVPLAPATWSDLRALVAVASETREPLSSLVPTNWLDPMLSGPNAVFRDHGPWGCPDIERLLRAVKARIVEAEGK